MTLRRLSVAVLCSLGLLATGAVGGAEALASGEPASTTSITLSPSQLREVLYAAEVSPTVLVRQPGVSEEGSPALKVIKLELLEDVEELQRVESLPAVERSSLDSMIEEATAAPRDGEKGFVEVTAGEMLEQIQEVGTAAKKRLETAELAHEAPVEAAGACLGRPSMPSTARRSGVSMRPRSSRAGSLKRPTFSGMF